MLLLPSATHKRTAAVHYCYIYTTVHGFLPVRYLISRAYISSRNGSFQHYFALHGNTISAKRILQCLTRNIASLQALCLNGVCRTDPSITRKCRPASFFLSFFHFFYILFYYFIIFITTLFVFWGERAWRGGTRGGVVECRSIPRSGQWAVVSCTWHVSRFSLHFYPKIDPEWRKRQTSPTAFISVISATDKTISYLLHGIHLPPLPPHTHSSTSPSCTQLEKKIAVQIL